MAPVEALKLLSIGSALPKSHNNTNNFTIQGSGRPATPVFCEVKLLFL